MGWLYELGEQSFELETRFDADSVCYQLIWRYPDGTTRTETFPETASFTARLRHLERELLGEGWRLSGSPRFLANGWAITRAKSE